MPKRKLNETYTINEYGECIFSKKLTYLDEYEFFKNVELKNITFPAGVAKFGFRALYQCLNLTKVTLNEGLTEIGDSGFMGCSALSHITIPKSVITIGAQAFTACRGLKTVSLTSGLTTIESFAFAHCSGLTNLTIPLGVNEINSYAFNGCTGLISITLPAGITYLKGNIFRDCSNLEFIIIDSEEDEEINRIKEILDEPFKNKVISRKEHLRSVVTPLLLAIDKESKEETNHFLYGMFNTKENQMAELKLLREIQKFI